MSTILAPDGQPFQTARGGSATAGRDKLQRDIAEQRLERMKAEVRYIYGSYDAAENSSDNIRHWAAADALSADKANNPEVREKLRNRARYEVANNTYARGITLTYTHYVVGTGPTLQVQTSDRDNGLPDQDTAEEIEMRWADWARRVGYAEKLRTMMKARLQDGEGVMVWGSDEDLPGVSLTPRPIEAERLASPWMELAATDNVDGVVLDEHGNAKRYYILNYHPGDGWAQLEMDEGEAETYKRDQVVHWFRSDRPEQHRGIPDLTPALPLFAQLRRYTLAVIRAAETAADIAAVIETDAPPGGDAVDMEMLDQIPLDKGVMTTLPAGWSLTGMTPEQPTTGYKEFKKEVINEVARCLNMPYNIAAVNSEDYNYASGRLDHQTFRRTIGVEQQFMGREVCDPTFDKWLDMANEEHNFGVETPLPHRWFWPGFEHVDPRKEAEAQERRLKNKTTTYAEEYAKEGKDWRTEFQQREREEQEAQERGITLPEPEGGN